VGTDCSISKVGCDIILTPWIVNCVLGWIFIPFVLFNAITGEITFGSFLFYFVFICAITYIVLWYKIESQHK